ncbi:hypothetical protein K431DRAFT_287327 [Polychaeton citri CBS 116435]|uniref:Uncharacterized protein n=1 Tax=Polychaeton citri CBS 116435 TaxID=1314669 RepID=A0A9P4Q3H6_9PEZI|nr:hypothetical protein K431DRAFT_287327 [Polychaeton citri CBS 116435]
MNWSDTDTLLVRRRHGVEALTGWSEKERGGTDDGGDGFVTHVGRSGCFPYRCRAHASPSPVARRSSLVARLPLPVSGPVPSASKSSSSAATGKIVTTNPQMMPSANTTAIYRILFVCSNACVGRGLFVEMPRLQIAGFPLLVSRMARQPPFPLPEIEPHWSSVTRSETSRHRNAGITTVLVTMESAPVSSRDAHERSPF